MYPVKKRNNFSGIIKSLKNIHCNGFITIECNENLKLLDIAENSIRHLHYP